MIEGCAEYSDNKKELYEEVVLQLKGLFEDCPHVTANLSNASAVLNQAMKEINWVGFYLMEKVGATSVNEDNSEVQKELLVLGPFQGKPACVEIPVGRGVCGTVAQKDEIQLVKNVHEFPGHIACDSASNSEIVLPIHKEGKVWGVLDIDSPILGRFDEEDRIGLAEVVKLIEEMLIHSGNGLL